MGRQFTLLAVSVWHPTTRWQNVTVTKMQGAGVRGVRLGRLGRGQVVQGATRRSREGPLSSSAVETSTWDDGYVRIRVGLCAIK
jgi:hypothetical protein